MKMSLELIGMALVVLGILLIFLGVLTRSESNSAGGVIFIGPMPFAFGHFQKPEIMRILWFGGLLIFLFMLAFIFIKLR
ncbi:hypothetical protein DRN67_02520 [Candidatus Micrarchaeota archaeon]|nr:MAG: hypothetical protein DRN67_02520 [Candidatus Micrarchaeota archaeon]